MIVSDERKRITIRDGAQAMEASMQFFLRMADVFSCNSGQFGLAVGEVKCAGHSFNGIDSKLNRVDEFGRASEKENDNNSAFKICTTSTPYL